MALTADTIPTMVSDAILETLQKQLVYSRLFNQNYTGSVAPGNAVKIPAIGSVTVKDYTEYEDMDEEEASDDSQTLQIDQQKYFNIVIDDIDLAMARPDILAAYAIEAAYQLRDTMDQFLSTVLEDGTITDDLGDDSTPIDVDNSNIEEQLRIMAQHLDEANVPRSGRVVVVPPWAVSKLVEATTSSLTNNVEVAANGMVGRYAGFDVLMSNNVPNDSDAKYKIIGGSSVSATMAMAINKTETMRHEKQFADKLRGLAVYGAKVTREDKLAVATWDNA